jgi:Tfp pilus assembly protein PilO
MNRNITALILIALAIGIYFTYTQNMISGSTDSIKTAMAKNSQYASAIDNAKSLQAIREKVNGDYNNISQDDLLKLNRMIPSAADNIHLIVDLSRLAQNKGLTLKNLTVTTVDDNTSSNMQNNGFNGPNKPLLPTLTLSNIKVSFGLSTSYQSFISFMQDIESSLRVMDVNHISLMANDTGVYDFSVDLTTYWLKQ